MRFFVLPVFAPALFVGRGLCVLRETGKQISVTRGDPLGCKRLGDGWNELQERQTGVDVACTLARLFDQCGYIVAGHVEQALKALRLLVRVHVHTLRVFDLSLVRQKLSMTSTTMEFCMSWNPYL